MGADTILLGCAMYMVATSKLKSSSRRKGGESAISTFGYSLKVMPHARKLQMQLSKLKEEKGMNEIWKVFSCYFEQTDVPAL